ncbi:MAG: hypothetical protein ACRDHS_15715 [Actinomycetota bacterium]
MAALVKWLIGLVTTGFVAFLALALTMSEPAPSSGMFPHSMLGADRVMAGRMALDVGTGMQYTMTGKGMLECSSNPAYLRALEEHTYVREVARLFPSSFQAREAVGRRVRGGSVSVLRRASTEVLAQVVGPMGTGRPDRRGPPERPTVHDL